MEDERFSAEEYFKWRGEGFGVYTMLAAKKYDLSLEVLSNYRHVFDDSDLDYLMRKKVPVEFAIAKMSENKSIDEIVDEYKIEQ